MSRARRAVRARRLHPGAWWAWAVAIAAAAMQTTNPLLLVLLGVVVLYVVSARRTGGATTRPLSMFLKLGLFVIAFRVALQALFGDRVAGHVLFSLPQVPLPSWAAGVSIGGPVTAEGLLTAADAGLRLAVVLVAFGAANTLANPYRLLKCVPTVLYEAGVAVTVALAYVPELAATIDDVRATRRLRGRATRGVAGLRGVAVPVLEGALERSLQLAASMDARGYGRRAPTNDRARRRSQWVVALGSLVVLVGLYDTTGSSAPMALGAALLAIGVFLVGWGTVTSGRRARRSRYRPDPWRAPEWLVLAAAVGVLVSFAIAHVWGATALNYDFSPLAWPSLPWAGAIGVVAAALPAFLSPPTPAPLSETGHELVVHA